MGVEGLLIYKYKLFGSGHVASSYGDGEGKRRFLHRPLPLSLPSAASGGWRGGATVSVAALGAAVVLAAVVGFGAGSRLGALRR